ncbi:collagen-like protein [Glaciibacter superstes]|uniref:collagen-like protein n=1 Tax=Glaciibacter superstes TaxID=501023 RepID=UPI0003B4E07B|nr:collagen-like protein [Glaciibacter superstes]
MIEKRTPGATIVAAIAVLGLLVTMVFLMVQVTDKDSKLAQLSTNSDALREQVKGLDETPVAPPAKEVTGQPGPVGATGPRGSPGEDGRDGIDGLPGMDGAPGVGVAGPSGVVGADGQDGASGAAGPAGPPGAASTVPGPAGANGVDGQPPLSWTYSDALDVTYLCTRTTPFDPAAPRYECAPTEGETP